MTRAATQEERWDRERDYRKHDFEPLPLRLQPTISPALEVAIAVKGTDNFTNAADLIERYARSTAAAVPLDRRCAVAKLVGYCEGLVGYGLLGEELETKLRRHIAEVLAIFNMPSKAERI